MEWPLWGRLLQVLRWTGGGGERRSSGVATVGTAAAGTAMDWWWWWLKARCSNHGPGWRVPECWGSCSRGFGWGHTKVQVLAVQEADTPWTVMGLGGRA